MNVNFGQCSTLFFGKVCHFAQWKEINQIDIAARKYYFLHYCLAYRSCHERRYPETYPMPASEEISKASQTRALLPSLITTYGA
jgi:hypothetical protein